jgi:hypothetical protein
MTITIMMTSGSKIRFLCEDEEAYDDGEFDDVWFGAGIDWRGDVFKEGDSDGDGEGVGDGVGKGVGKSEGEGPNGVGENGIGITSVTIKESDVIKVVSILESWT